MSLKKSYKIITHQETEIISEDFSAFVAWIQERSFSRIVLVYDVQTKKQAQKISKALSIKIKIPLKVQENLKSPKAFLDLQKKFFEASIDRKSLVLVLGGGVMGDLLGLVCHTYMRGVEWVSIPSTLLAQVDSGCGGKNAINQTYAKNVLGTVYQPSLVYLDSSFLKTLPPREWMSGVGEILKYNFLMSQESIDLSTFDVPHFKKIDWEKLAQVIRACVDYKMSLVEKDPWDKKGIRQKLNLGHTLAHALETLTRYRAYRHGEAVLWGLQFSLIVSKNKKLISSSCFSKEMQKFKGLPLRKIPSHFTGTMCFNIARGDKKSVAGQVRMVLPQSKGRVQVSVEVSRSEFLKAYRELLNGEFYA